MKFFLEKINPPVGGFFHDFCVLGIYGMLDIILPVYRGFMMRDEVVVGFAEMATAKKAVMSGEGGWVSGGENEVFLTIDKICFGFGVVTPEEKDEIFSVVA